MRHRRGRGKITGHRDQRFDAVGRQYLERGLESGRRQGVRVDADEQGPLNTLLLAIKADRLSDSKNVRLVEASVERRAAMAGRAEGHALGRYRWIGPQTEVGRDQFRDIDQLRSLRGSSGQRTDIRIHQTTCVSRDSAG